MIAPAVAKPPRIRLVLVDDSEVVRMGLRALIGTDPALEILGEAGTAALGIQTCVTAPASRSAARF